MSAWGMRAVTAAALVCGIGVIALVLGSDREDAEVARAVFAPIVVWSFVGTGLYAWHRRPASRVGLLMVLLGFAWCIAALAFASSRCLQTFAAIFGGLWGGVFLHLLMSFPAGRLARGRDRTIAITGRVRRCGRRTARALYPPAMPAAPARSQSRPCSNIASASSRLISSSTSSRARFGRSPSVGHASWRWFFYVNVPTLAFTVVAFIPALLLPDRDVEAKPQAVPEGAVVAEAG